ncbi:hypothetical protein MPSEU_000440500 [Mayamaea pseudoterrestris]|nr:hypothetical protein MPSEU_000440500 [Mayamaea pseudoterrestris]
MRRWTMRLSRSAACMLLFHISKSAGFTTLVTNNRHASTRHCHLSCNVLTERQMQFWEDVDDGLDDIENFWRKQNQDIDRIRTFAARAQGKLSLPTPSAAGHEPSEEHVDGLTTKPFWNAAEDLQLFPWAQDLEASAHIIQAEYETKLNTSMVFATDSIWQNQVMGQGWSAVRLQRLGVWNTETCLQFPETFRLLKSLKIPLAVRGVCFAKQTPGTGVQPHSDGRNFILTSHLGLDGSGRCAQGLGARQADHD